MFKIDKFACNSKFQIKIKIILFSIQRHEFKKQLNFYEAKFFIGFYSHHKYIVNK